MQTIDLLLKRKSVRNYTDEEISLANKEIILNAAFNAPTAGNMQLYSIIDVIDKNTLNELSIICDNQKFINKSKMTLVFLADSTKWYKMYKKYELSDIKPTIADYFLGFSDALCAAQNAVTAAETLDIGSCYIGDICEEYEKVKELLNLPDNVLPVAMLVFGYKTQEQKDRIKPIRFPREALVFQDRYNDYSLDECEELFLTKITNTTKLDNIDLKQKTKTYVTTTFKFKQNNRFFNEMNRSLKAMLKDLME